MAYETKAELRNEFLKKRDALPDATRAKASAAIRQRLLTHPQWKAASTILCYVSFGSEVDTHEVIHEAFRVNKHVIVPVHDPRKQETPLSELRQFADLGPSHRGILQMKPECIKLASPNSVQLAILPGIVFDRKGGRIGFGGGYFDRLLPLMPQSYRLAMAYKAQLYSRLLPLERHDVAMQTLLTEDETLEIDRSTEKL